MTDIDRAGTGAGGDWPAGLTRTEVYGTTDPAVGANVPARALAWLRELVTTNAQREERALDRQLLRASPSRTNYVAFASPKGGVGKTTCTLLCGELLAGTSRLRCVAVDANPDYGTLGSLAGDGDRSDRSLVDVLDRLETLRSPAELRPYVATLPSGLHILAAPATPEAMDAIGADRYAELCDFLGRLYDVVLLDLGTGLTDPLVRFALERADQLVVVSTPEWVTAERVIGALGRLTATQASERLTLVLNQAPVNETTDRQVIEAAFRRAEVRRRVAIPYDPRLRALLDAGAYRSDALCRPTRVAVKQLAVAVADQLI